MKNSMILLGLTTLAQMGFAENASTYDRTNECCECVCCRTCKKDINCECYVPKYYNLKCDCGFFVSADFLYWYGRDTRLPYAIKNRTVFAVPDNIFTATPIEFKYLKTSWDPGVRASLGYNSGCDGWDYSVSWTYYRNTRSDKISVSPFPEGAAQENCIGLVDPWVNTTGEQGVFIEFERVTANYKMRLNYVDFELGRKYWLSKCFTMRPFVAVRAAWMETDFNTKAVNPLTASGTGSFLKAESTSAFNNCNWGAGFLLGADPSFYFTPCFSLFGRADVSLLWGEFKTKKKETILDQVVTAEGEFISDDVNYSNETKMDQHGMQSILDLALGLRYENTYCDCQYRFAVDLGWEHHIWFNNNRRFAIVGYDQSPSGQNDEIREVRTNETSHNTEFGGLVIRARFDF